jgi:putative FmdB family regulatory protein
MPIYEYRCQTCQAEFEELIRSPRDERDLTCTQCNSPAITRRLSVPAAPQSAAAPLPAAPSCGQCGGVPGSCQFGA